VSACVNQVLHCRLCADEAANPTFERPIGLRLALAPLVVLGRDFGWFPWGSVDMLQIDGWHTASPHTLLGSLFYMVCGIVIVTALMHAARGVARGHARLAKALLVVPGA